MPHHWNLHRGNLHRCAGLITAAWVALHIAASTAFADPLDVNWSSDFGAPGLEGNVLAAVNWSGTLVVAGEITHAGGKQVQNVVQWNGAEFAQMGSGLDAAVRSLAVVGSTLYAAGDFTASGATSLPNVARWTGSAWVAVGASALDDPSELSLAVDGSSLLLLGRFTSVGAVAAQSIASWNGSAWSAIGTFPAQGLMRAAVRLGSRLYTGGDFYDDEAGEARALHYWDGSSWTYDFGDLDGPVISLAVVGSDLYIHGEFYSADYGNIPAEQLARWDGSSFSSLNDVSPDGAVNRIGVDNGQLFVVGSFVNNPGPYCAYWDGANWNGGPDRLYGGPWLTSFARVGSDLVLAGRFAGFYDYTMGGIIRGAKNVAAWNGSQFRALGPGFGLSDSDNDYLLAAASYAGQLIAAGEFAQIGRTGGVNGIAAWDGTQWNTLGTGLTQTQGGPPSGDRLATWNGRVVVTGYLTGAGTVTSSCIVAWNGTDWEGFAGGFEGQGARMADYAGQLIVSGYLGTEYGGGTTLGQVARWTGSQWQTIGTISPSSGASATKVTVWNGKLVAAGIFTSINGVPAVNIAQWDGASWSALGSGLNGFITALAAHDGDLYASGLFTASGATPIAGRIARWDGVNWTPVGSGFDAAAETMTSADGRLYASGQFGTAGGNPAARIASWDGAAWSALGSGLGEGVGGNSFAANSITAHNGGLFAVGFFNTAGDKSSRGIARWDLGTTTAVAPGRIESAAWVSPPSPNPASGHVGLSFHLVTESVVEAAVFDVSGRRVRTLAAGRFAAAEHRVTWDGLDDAGRAASSGVYYIRLAKEGGQASRKVIWYR